MNNMEIRDIILAKKIIVGDCWLWKIGINKAGYGHIHIDGKNKRAHRISFQVFNQKDPGKLKVCHKCDTPLCINPAHLFLGTDLDNARDRKRKGRNATSKQTHCKRGHILSGDNLIPNKRNRRICKQCERDRCVRRSII
jgi:hypothetical protein